MVKHQIQEGQILYFWSLPISENAYSSFWFHSLTFVFLAERAPLQGVKVFSSSVKQKTQLNRQLDSDYYSLLLLLLIWDMQQVALHLHLSPKPVLSDSCESDFQHSGCVRLATACSRGPSLLAHCYLFRAASLMVRYTSWFCLNTFSSISVCVRMDWRKRCTGLL